MYGSGQWTVAEGYVANKFVKGGFGPEQHRPQRAPLHGVLLLLVSTMAWTSPPVVTTTLTTARFSFLWGNNPAECHPGRFFAVWISDRSAKGGNKILFY